MLIQSYKLNYTLIKLV